MKPLTETLAALSDEAKYVAMFEMRGSNPVSVFQVNNNFFGPVYDAAIAELQASGVISELAPPTHYCSIYQVHHDLDSIGWWYVAQDRDYRERLGRSLSRRVPDDRDVAIALKGIDFAIDMIKAQKHNDLEPRDIIDSVDRMLKETRLKLVSPGPQARKTKYFPTTPQHQVDSKFKKKDVEKALGGLKAKDGGDPSKSRYEWFFTVDGEKCSIWDWKGVWCAFGPAEAFAKLNLTISKW
jgi:hypothetical protein